MRPDLDGFLGVIFAFAIGAVISGIYWMDSVMTNSVKLCKDCKWVALHSGDTHAYSYCTSPKLKRSPVDGEVIRMFAWISRESGFCGPTASWFEPKEFIITEKTGPMTTVEWWR